MPAIVDYSWGRPPPADIVAAGYMGAMRYLGEPSDGRCIQRPELDALHAAGLGVGLIWETTAGRALEGWGAGVTDGGRAGGYAAALGAPGWVPIYFTCDTDVTDSQARGPVLDYFAGATTGVHPARCYGEAGVLDVCHDELAMPHGWQTGASSWSGGRVSQWCSLLQYPPPYVLNDTSDHNEVLCPVDLVDWLWYGGNDDMPLNEADLNAITHIVNDAINATMAKMYAGHRAIQVAGETEVYELVYHAGELCKRHIPTTEEFGMLQWVDHVAGEKGAPARILTDARDIAAFQALAVV